MRARLIHGLLASAVVAVVACSSTDDGGVLSTAAEGTDAGTDTTNSGKDAGSAKDSGGPVDGEDASADDAGTDDAGTDDAGTDDASTDDASTDDAGGDADTDAGIDAGPSCAVDNGGCAANAACDDSKGTVACACLPGYEGDGKTCALATANFTVDANLSTTNTGTRACADGGDMVAYNVVGLDGATATLATTPAAGCLSAGDEVLVINLQGTKTASANTGNYELRTVSAVSATTVTFTAAKAKFFGDGAADDTNLGLDATNQRVVLQRVPRYGNVTIAAGVRLSADAWNGTKGGVFAFSAAGQVTSDGSIDVSGLGYRGAAANAVVNTTGQQGESYDGAGAAATQTASSGGGGGGRGDNTGCTNYGLAAGGAGYGTVGGDALTAQCGGKGGMAYGDDGLSKLFFGSGGGSGGTDNVLFDNPHGGAGGAGGGIVHVRADGAVQGNLIARGAAGEGDLDGVDCSSADTNQCWDYSGPGGGGAGGSIVVVAPTFTGTSDVAGGAAGHGWSSMFQLAGAGGLGRAKTP